MAESRSYPKATVGKDGWTDWMEPARVGRGEYSFTLACCDCGLVHDHRFETGRHGLRFKVRREDRSTGQLRRAMIRYGEGIFHSSRVHRIMAAVRRAFEEGT